MKVVELKLPAQLDLGASVRLKDEMTAAASSASGLIVDGSEVERASTPGIQLLLAAEKIFAGEDRHFGLKTPSEALTQALDDLGLGDAACRWGAA